MASFSWRRWLSGFSRVSRNVPVRRFGGRLPVVEALESRVVLAARTWIGGVSNLWSDAGNWQEGVAPVNDDDLSFGPSGVQRTTVNDLPNLRVNLLSFSSSGYTLNGNSIVLGTASATTGFIIANLGATNNTVNFDIELGGAAGNRQFFTVGTQGAVLALNGQLSGNTGVEITKDGLGTLILNGNNIGFTGPITVQVGIIRIGHGNALGDTSSGTTVLNGGQVQTANVVGVIPENLTINGTGPENDGALENFAGNNVWTGNVAMDSDSTIGSQAPLADNLTIQGIVSDTATRHNLTKEGSGRVTLDPLNNAAGNVYRGRTIINAGVLTIRHSHALGVGMQPGINDTVVNSTPDRSGTLELEYVTNPARIDPSATDNFGGPLSIPTTSVSTGGFIVPDENLILNGPGFEGVQTNIFNITGALSNRAGNNQWQQDISIWTGEVPDAGTGQTSTHTAIGAFPDSSLALNGVISDGANVGGVSYTLDKVGFGRVIFTNHNTYRGTTQVVEGWLNIRDSQALGDRADGLNRGTSVLSGATLELEADSKVDSFFGGSDTRNNKRRNTDMTIDSETILINGRGMENRGVIRNISGINRWERTVTNVASNQTGRSDIGVEADPDPFNNDGLAFNDFSQLTIDGQMTDPTPFAFKFYGPQWYKIGFGELVITNNTNDFLGRFFINEGWVTARADNAMGGRLLTLSDTQQPDTTVSTGAALHVKVNETTGLPVTLVENLVLQGIGITHRDDWLNQKGALVSMAGDNLVSGDISLVGQVGIGSEIDRDYDPVPLAVSELTLTGMMRDFVQNIVINRNASGGPAEDRFLIDTGAVSGNVIINYDFFTVPDQLRIYYEGNRLFDSGVVSGAAVVNQAYGPGASTFVEIVMNEGSGIFGTIWTYTVTIQPNSTVGGGIIKLGSRRVNLQGDGTYSNENEVREGVLRVQNDTALGGGAKGTIVLTGAALEIGQSNSTNTGGISSGIQIWNEQITLSGVGITDNRFGAPIATLTNLNGDNLLRGAIRFLTNVEIDSKADSRLHLWGNITDTGAVSASGFDKIGIGTLLIRGNNSFRGDANIEAGIVNIQSGTALGSSEGGTVVANNAAIELQGDITIAGEPLRIQGVGPGAVPSIPQRWFQVGPSPVTNGEATGNPDLTGRMTGVAASPSDPNEIFVSMGSGGLWKTKDGGRSWIPMLDDYVAAALGQGRTIFTGGVAVQRNTWLRNRTNTPTEETNYVYVALGEGNFGSSFQWDNGNFTDYRSWRDTFYGWGILKSMDFGKTWTYLTPPANALSRHAISKIKVDPIDPEIVYMSVVNQVAGSNNAISSGLWRYNGNTNTWTNLITLNGSMYFTGSRDTNPASIAYNTVGDSTDFDIAQDTRFTNNRFITFAMANPLGSTNQNFVYTSIDNGVRFWAAGWTDPTDTGNNTTAPHNGAIKVALDPDSNTYRVYASIAYPTSYRIDRTLQGRLHEMRRLDIVWDAANVRWNEGAWGGLTAPPADPLLSSIPVMTKPNNLAPFATQGQGAYSHVLAVDENTRDVYFGGVNSPVAGGGLYRGPGGGAWIDVGRQPNGAGPGPFAHWITFDANGRVLMATDTGLWRLDNPNDGSEVWTELNGNIGGTNLVSLAVHPTDPNIAIAGAYTAGTARFDGNEGWTRTGSGPGGVVLIDPKNPLRMYRETANYIDNFIERSDDGGVTWTPAVNGINRPYVDYSTRGGSGKLFAPFVMDAVNTSRLLVGTYRLYESTNGGTSWTPLIGELMDFYGPLDDPGDSAHSATDPFQPINITAIGLSQYQGPFAADAGFPASVDLGSNTYDPDTIYIALDPALDGNPGARLLVTKNHGANWVDRTAGLPAGNYTQIAVDPRNRDVAFVVRNVFGGQQIYMTRDAGVTWLNISGTLPDVPAWAITVDPRTGTLYLGNDVGVFSLTEANLLGANYAWNRYGSGLPNVQVRQIVVNQTLNTLNVATYGRGAFQLWLDSSRPNAGAIRGISGSAVWTGPVTITGDVTINAEGTLAVQNFIASAQITFVGAISGNGNVDKIGEGRVVFAGNNSYTGVTNINQGILVVRNPNALGSAAQQTIVNDGTALEIQANLNNEQICVFGNGVLINGHYTGAIRNTSNFNTVTGTIIIKTPITTFGVDSGSQLTITGRILDDANRNVPVAPSLQLVKELPGTLILAGDNDYAGLTVVNQGALTVAHNKGLGKPGTVDVSGFPTLGAGDGTVVRDGAQLRISGNITVTNEELYLSGQGINGTGAFRNTTGVNTWAGNVILGSLPAIPSPPPPVPSDTIVFAVDVAGDSLDINGIISEHLTVHHISKIGTGNLIFEQNNSYTGLTTVRAGSITIRSQGALGSTLNGTVVLSGAALNVDHATGMVVNPEPLTLNGVGLAPDNVGALVNTAGNNTWSGPITLGTVAATGATVAIGAATGTTLTITGDLIDPPQPPLPPPPPPPPTPPPTLIKTLPGTVIIPNVKSFTGETRIDAGVLQVDGGLTSIRLNGGTLAGSGTVTTVTSNSPGGTVSPGTPANGVGILHTGAVTWNANTSFYVNINNNVTPGVDFDQLQVTGDINLAGANLTGKLGASVDVGEIYPIITYTGTRSNKFAQGDLIFLDGKKFTINYDDTNKRVFLQRIKAEVIITLAPTTPTVYGETIVFTVTITPEAGANSNLLGEVVTIQVDGGGAVNLPGLDANNQTTYTITGGLSVGTHTISIAYPGDADFNSKTSAFNHTVNKADTTITAVTSNASPVYGQAITITATVNPVAPGAGDPTNFVRFVIDGVTTIDANVNPTTHEAFIVLSNLSAGTHTIAISYLGDGNFNGSTLTPSFSQTVLKANTTTTGFAAPASVRYGQTTTLFVDVNAAAPGGGDPAGDVNLFLGSTLLGTITLGAFGLGQLPLASIDPGVHTITATYTGNGNYNGSTGTFNLTVTKADTTGALTVSSTTSTYGQSLTFGLDVDPVAPGGGSPDGSFQLRIDGQLDPTVRTLGAAGVASFNISDLTAGTHTIDVVYAGSTRYNGSTSNTVTVTVAKANTSSVLVSNVNPSVFGLPATFVVTISTVAPGQGTPTGTVTFVIDGTNQAPVNVVNGQATLVTSTLGIGVHTVQAIYNGSPNFETSTSNSVTQTVLDPRATTLSLTQNRGSSVFGQGVTFTLAIGPKVAGRPTPTGTATFFDGTKALGTVNLVNGTATFSTTALAAGAHSIRAVYNGSTEFDSNASSNLSHTVAAASTRTVLTTSSPTAAAGSSVTFTANVTPVAPGAGVPTGTVTFRVNGVAKATIALVNGQARFTTKTLQPGTLAITATYNATTNYKTSTGSVSQRVLAVSLAINPVLVASVKAGTVFTARVEYRNQTGKPDTTFNGNVSVSVATGPGRIVGTLTVKAVRGIATFKNLRLDQAGSYTLRFSGGLALPIVSRTLVVTASKLSASVSPVKPAVAEAFSISVRALDALNKIATNFSGTATLKLISAPFQGAISGPKTVRLTRGVGTLSGLTINRSGNYTVELTAGTLKFRFTFNALGRRLG